METISCDPTPKLRPAGVVRAHTGFDLINSFKRNFETTVSSPASEMDEQELEAARASRVKELEAMVLKLEQENKNLLNKVTESAEKYEEEASGRTRDPNRRRERGVEHASSVEELISLDSQGEGEAEDEW